MVVSGRGQEALDKALKGLEDEGVEGARAIGQTCDVADVTQVQALWDYAVNAFGSVDYWINNAGFARSGPTLLQLTPDEITVMVQGNVIGTITAEGARTGMQALLSASAEVGVIPRILGTPGLETQAVTTALVDWPASLILVSHDIDFVRQLAPTKVLLMPDGDVDYFSEDWLDLVELS